MTWLELAKEEARRFGVEWTDAEADYALWEFTGFPAFWPAGMSPTEACRKQLQEHLEACGGRLANGQVP